MFPLFSAVLEEATYYMPALQYRLGPGRHQPRLKLLVNGVPKSGTTWLMRMLASLPGYRAVGNFHGEISRYETVQPGQIVHSHDYYSLELCEALRANDIRVLCIVRDLRDQAVSRMFHLKRDESHAWQPLVKGMSKDEALMLSIEGHPPQDDLPALPGVLSWRKLTHGWLTGELEPIRLRYEAVVADTAREMSQLFECLDIVMPQGLLKAIIRRNRFERLTVGRKFWQQGRGPGQENPTSHFRKGIVGDWRNHFNQDHRQRFKELAGDWLVEMGYEANLEW
jgi:hypothetical protein